MADTALTTERMHATGSIHDTGSDRVFNIVNYVILSFFLFAVFYPLIYVVSASISDPTAVVSGEVWLWPVRATLDGYRAVFENNAIITGFRNSILYATVGTFVNVVMTILAAYPLSRQDLRGRGIIMFLFVFTLLFGGGLIPTYLVVKETGLLNSYWALIIPSALSVYNMIITVTFFRTAIPGNCWRPLNSTGAATFGSCATW